MDFKSKAKAFVRAYGFLAAILPYSNAGWERLSIFLNFLIPKLPAPREEDLSRGILEAIDMDSYRVEVKAGLEIGLLDQDAEIEPAPASGGAYQPEPELEPLSDIIQAFNDQFGNIDWKDADKIRQIIAAEIPGKVAADAVKPPRSPLLRVMDVKAAGVKRIEKGSFPPSDYSINSSNWPAARHKLNSAPQSSP